MLDGSGDYDWVNVSGISDISGDVLPARDEAGDGSWQILDYEDYLFLLEAYYERTNWDSTPSSLIRIISSSVLITPIPATLPYFSVW